MSDLDIVKDYYKDYRPGFVSYKKPYREWVDYERSFYCKENYIIHHSLKAVSNCIHCMKKIKSNGN